MARWNQPYNCHGDHISQSPRENTFKTQFLFYVCHVPLFQSIHRLTLIILLIVYQHRIQGIRLQCPNPTRNCSYQWWCHLWVPSDDVIPPKAGNLTRFPANDDITSGFPLANSGQAPKQAILHKFTAALRNQTSDLGVPTTVPSNHLN